MLNKKARAVGLAIMAVAVAFLVHRFLSFGVDFAELFTAGALPGLLFVTACTMATFFIASVGWTILLSFFAGKRVPVIPTYGLYMRANIAKYLPGNVGHYAMRQIYGASLGIKQRDMLVSSVLEIACMAFAAFILSLLLGRDTLLHYLGGALRTAWVPPVLVAAVCACVAGAIIFMRKKGFSLSDVTSYFKRKGFPLSVAAVIGLTMCSLFIYGGTLLFLFGPVPEARANALLVISASIVSWFVGFVTPGVPGGIGVREAALLLMLSPVLPDDIVLHAALLQRLAFVFSDVLSWVAGKAIEKRDRITD